MNNFQDNPVVIPEEQLRIRAKCYHPSGIFKEFKKEDIEQSIPDRFEDMVRLYPDMPAVKDRHEAVTYTELNEQANKIAHAILAQRGVRSEPVALLLEKGVQAVAACLGILKAGKFYVPLDQAYPDDRMAYMLEDAHAELIVTHTQALDQFPQFTSLAGALLTVDTLAAETSSENVDLSLSPDALAYIIYTSGSTGQPKGVMQTHRNVLHKIMGPVNAHHICPADHVAYLASPSSSAAVWNIFSALCSGASLYPFNVKHAHMDELRQWLHQEAITYATFLPAVFRQLVSRMAENETFPHLRLIFLGGETLAASDVDLYKAAFSRDCVLITNLSSTETGDCSRYYIDKDTVITNGVVPVGYPIPDKEVLFLDEDDNEVGINQIGEIVVRSRYLSPGYWRQPELTKAKFLPDPKGGDHRLYRTGDLGRRNADGCMLHIGRKDFQVKVRGQRVDVLEIQALLVGLNAVKEAVVIQRQDDSKAPRLVAYMVPTHHPVPTISTLRRALEDHLAPHMIPSAFVWLDALPLTPAKKLDRCALHAPDRSRPLLDNDYVAPRTPIEAELARLWEDLLELDMVGIHDPFLDLGGHSLLATQLLTRVIQTFQVALPLRTLLETSTIAEMALLITQKKAEKVDREELGIIMADLEKLSEKGPAGAFKQEPTVLNKRLCDKCLSADKSQSLENER